MGKSAKRKNGTKFDTIRFKELVWKRIVNRALTKTKN